MEIKRLALQLAVCCIPKAKRRVEFLKKHRVFHECGKNVRIQSRKIPLYPNLIAFHNNIWVASHVTFLTHDAMHTMFRCKSGDKDAFQEKVGCIEIFDNVFIGSNTTIVNGVKIGPNAVVAAGSVITKDVPEGSVVGGVPARVIGSFDALEEKRRAEEYPKHLSPKKQRCSKELEEYLWAHFKNSQE